MSQDSLPNPPKKAGTLTRRNFFKASTLVCVGGAAAYGLASVPLLKSKELHLRPPGALEEDVFLASCIKCGQCLQVCPPQVISLAGIRQGFGIGTPFIVPREGACILCKGLPCVLACPTGALDHHISEGKEAEMGLAVLRHPDTCLSVNRQNDLLFLLESLPETAPDETIHDLLTALIPRLNDEELETFKQRLELETVSLKVIPVIIHKLNEDHWNWLKTFVKNSSQSETPCRVCFEECPIKSEQTITFEEHTDVSGKTDVRPVVQRTCVGCGVCEMKCPTPVPSITITPRLKWKEISA
ncbi:MAG: 4Fe-4S dicluster domain-containing protein [SAR324 cluster bacterium]|nr:4Fe-4S dicluster domain-containing protein [SAR324 cluster bacterium]